MRTAALLSCGTLAAALTLAILLNKRGRRFNRRALLFGLLAPRRPRIAYINTEDADKWKDQLDVFARALGLPEAAFERFDAYNGEYPSALQLRLGRYDGVLITGSHYSAVDPSLAWLDGLFECIRNCAKNKHVRLLGCCFGCQAVSVALGGQVGNNPDGKFVFGTETIRLQTTRLSEYEWARDALTSKDVPFLPKHLSLLQSHGEQVLALPPSADLLGSSATAQNELFVCGEQANILCCQSHPEFDVKLVRERIEPALLAKGRVSEQEMGKIVTTMERSEGLGEIDSGRGRALYRRFLVGSVGD